MGDLITNPLFNAGHIIHIDPTGQILPFNCGTVHRFINHCLWLKIRWCLY